MDPDGRQVGMGRASVLRIEQLDFPARISKKIEIEPGMHTVGDGDYEKTHAI